MRIKNNTYFLKNTQSEIETINKQEKLIKNNYGKNKCLKNKLSIKAKIKLILKKDINVNIKNCMIKKNINMLKEENNDKENNDLDRKSVV